MYDISNYYFLKFIVLSVTWIDEKLTSNLRIPVTFSIITSLLTRP